MASGRLIPQRHGGALRNGGPNRGGPGRLPSAIRNTLRESFSDRIPLIHDIADGKPIQRIDVPLLSVLPHVVCANCGESQIAPKDPSMTLLISIEGTGSASPGDRLKAVDLLAKYGLGVTKELSVEAVRDRLEQTVAILRSTLPPATADKVLDALDPVWRS